MFTTARHKLRKAILCVDDDLATLNCIYRILRPLDYVIIPIRDPHCGLKLAQAFMPDLVLLDIGMPGLNGYEFLDCFRDQESNKTPVVFLTANPDKSAGYRAGCAEYITKPYTADMLRDTVRHLLNRQSEDDRRNSISNL